VKDPFTAVTGATHSETGQIISQSKKLSRKIIDFFRIQLLNGQREGVLRKKEMRKMEKRG